MGCFWCGNSMNASRNTVMWFAYHEVTHRCCVTGDRWKYKRLCMRNTVWYYWYYWDLRTINNAKPYFFLNEMNKIDLPEMYSTAFWCLFVVLLFFFGGGVYCVTTVTTFIERSEGWSLWSGRVLVPLSSSSISTCRYFKLSWKRLL